jgi:hypothetical protein
MHEEACLLIYFELECTLCDRCRPMRRLFIPRVELHLHAVPARDHAEAVVLDLVQPLRLARRLRSVSGKARRDEARRQGTRT